jgi:hypothetical protein
VDRNRVVQECAPVQVDRLLGGEADGDLVGAHVAGNVGVAAHVVPRDAAAPAFGDQREQRFPQIAVEDRLSLGSRPTAPAPAVNPLRDAADDVGRIGVQRDATGLAAQILQRRDDAGQLHLIIGGVRSPCAQLSDRAVRRHHDSAPAAGAGISLCSAVAEDDDCVGWRHG